MNVLKYLLLAVGVLLLLYHSVYFEKLSDRRQAQALIAFNAVDYAADLWQKLQAESVRAVDVGELLDLFETDLPAAVSLYGRTLGISRSHSFLLKGEGRLIEVTDEAAIVAVRGETPEVVIVTDFIFGNDIRDASGLVRVSDFPSTMEFNSISAEINKIVVSQVLPPILPKAQVGRRLRFVGAATINDEQPQFRPLRVTPIDISLIQD